MQNPSEDSVRSRFSFEEFAEVFRLLLGHYGRQDDNGFYARSYFKLLVRDDDEADSTRNFEATADEVYDAIEQCINNSAPKMPGPRDLRLLIFESRQDKGIKALPLPVEGKTHDFRQARIAFCAGIYRHSDDTALYRSYLGKPFPQGEPVARNPFGNIAATLTANLPPVTHDEVMAYVERTAKSKR